MLVAFAAPLSTIAFKLMTNRHHLATRMEDLDQLLRNHKQIKLFPQVYGGHALLAFHAFEGSLSPFLVETKQYRKSAAS